MEFIDYVSSNQSTALLQGIMLVTLGWALTEIIKLKVAVNHSQGCITRIEALVKSITQRFEGSHKETEV